ncbi:hypothetical protein Daesc_007913 [Daldinia eschscholtzii]|uniref:ABM domain-containing protein n=1 Tax=Daldinia eschscholtzii TaxID=292717 RepID=A0AAX6MFA0_9PEZI
MDIKVNEASSSSNVLTLHVSVLIAPENVDKFLKLFKAVFDLVAAEPECLFFEVYKSVEEPGKIAWVEHWSKDLKWFMENQMTKPYYKKYLELTEPLFVTPREALILEPLGPEFLVDKKR